MNYQISIFGSALPLPGSQAYEAARNLGNKLGKARYTILTGGYSGIMEAASLGAFEVGGHVIGVTCNEIEKWRNTSPNKWVQEEIRLNTLQERINKLIANCDAAIALGGGIGTLAEIVLMWNGMQVNSWPVKPLILVGVEWQDIFSTLFKNSQGYILSEHKDILLFADGIDQAYELLVKKLN